MQGNSPTKGKIIARTAKTPRFEEFNKSRNAFGHRAQDPQTWGSYLDDTKPLSVELGCGKAELSLFLAEKYPDHNYIGIDLKADRLWRASKTALSQNLNNIAFVQGNILQIDEYIKSESVSLIWITHPDPFPKDRQSKHRMLNRNFLDIYKSILQEDGIIRFKTDNKPLFEWAIEFLDQQKDVIIDDTSNDLHAEYDDEDILEETTFSKKYIEKGTPINYMQFRFK